MQASRLGLAVLYVIGNSGMSDIFMIIAFFSSQLAPIAFSPKVSRLLITHACLSACLLRKSKKSESKSKSFPQPFLETYFGFRERANK